MRATSIDVARLAGVSQSTVSRALRDEPGMSRETRNRVRQAAAALGYVVIERGRSLATRATGRIGVVAPDLTNPFYPELIDPIRSRLQALGYRAVLLADRGESPVDIVHLADGSLDGVILTTSTLSSPLPALLTARSIPCVLLNRDVDGIDMDRCVADNRTGASHAAELVVGLGHTRVAAVVGTVESSTGRDREAGFRDVLSHHGITVAQDAFRHGPFSHETGRRHGLELLGGAHPPTAILCGNDVIAIGVLNAVAALGIRLGSEVTVTGFDDIAMAAWDVYELSTVRCDRAAMASAAVEMLVSRIGDPTLPTRTATIATALVPRATHGAPPRAVRAGLAAKRRPLAG